MLHELPRPAQLKDLHVADWLSCSRVCGVVTPKRERKHSPEYTVMQMASNRRILLLLHFNRLPLQGPERRAATHHAVGAHIRLRVASSATDSVHTIHDAGLFRKRQYVVACVLPDPHHQIKTHGDCI